MKRLDVEPTKTVLLDSISHNLTGRNVDIIDFVKMLAETEGPYAYMVDAPWGDGKTFFIKSIALVLEAMNPHITKADVYKSELSPVLNGLNETDMLALPFYFNAWSNDFSDDPLTTLFASMATEFDRYDLLKASKIKMGKGIAAVIDAGLAVNQIPFQVSGAASALTSESLIASFKSKAEIRDRINQLANESIIEIANKLVIFVDELDRCRPDFAVRLLEQTKSLFNSENTIFVFSADSCQLAKAIGGIYGPGFDTPRFLERFFDERITMSPVNSIEFVSGDNIYNTRNKFDRFASELIRNNALTIRDAYRIQHKLECARKFCLEGPNDELPQMIASCTILPLLVFIERNDNGLFRRITSGADFNALYEIGSQFPSFNDNIKDAIIQLRRHMPGTDKAKPTDAECKAYMHDLCVTIYGVPNEYPEFFNAKERIGGFAPHFDARIYKQLKFD